MQLLLALAVLAALMISENCPNQPVSGAGFRLLLAALGVTGLGVFAAVGSGRIASRLTLGQEPSAILLRRFRRLRRCHTVLWLAVAGATLYGLRWSQLVRFNWQLDHCFLLDYVMILAPVLLPVVVSWAAFYDVERAMRLCLTGEATFGMDVLTRGQYVLAQVRHHLGILLVPVLLLLAVHEVARWIIPDSVEEKPTYLAASSLPALGALMACFPWLLRHIWQTRPLAAGPLRQRLEAAARHAGLRIREILVWDTRGLMINAAVAGFLPSLRYVFLSDGLLAHLTDEQIEAVFGHEMGHVRYRHLALRVLAMLAPLAVWLFVEQLFPQLGEWLIEEFAAWGVSPEAGAAMVVLPVAGVYAFLIFGACSRMLEAQADLFGCHTLASQGPMQAAHTLITALETLADASGMDRQAASWQHGSIARRVEFLERAAADPRVQQRLQRRVRLLGTILTALAAGPILYLLFFAE